MSTPVRPYCTVCGWRKGGLDSWDGKACKCGMREPPMPAMPVFAASLERLCKDAE